MTACTVDSSNRAALVGSYLSERSPDEEHTVGGGCVAESRCRAARSAAAGAARSYERTHAATQGVRCAIPA